MNHRELCLKAAKYLRSKKVGYPYSVCELERVGESPDAFAFGAKPSYMIEAKASRSDFLSDKRKYARRMPDYGIGELRSYICPTGLIKESELPEFWGLLYVNEKGKIEVIRDPEKQPFNLMEEMKIFCSLLRREGIPPKMFSYKKYKDEQVEIEPIEKVIESYEQV